MVRKKEKNTKINKESKKSINNALKISELKYRRLFETAQDGILLVDYKTGMIMDANKFLIDILDYSKNAFLGKHLWEVGVFKDIAASKKNFLTLQKKKYVRFENLPLETKKGKKIAVEFVANAYSVGKEMIIQCNVRDITDRRKAETESKISSEKFKSIFDYSSVGVSIVSPEGRWLEVNDALCKITGYSRKELLKDNVRDITHPDDKGLTFDAFSKVLSGQTKHVEFEKRYIKKNGEIIWVRISTAAVYSAQKVPVYFVTHTEEITERKKTEEIIFKEQMFNKTLIDSIPGTFYMLDEKGFYARWNSYQRDEIVGKPENEVSKTNAIDTIYPDDRAHVGAKIVNVLQKGIIESVEGRVLLRGGPEFRWLLMTGRRMIVEGKPFLVGIGIDITERKYAEQQIVEIKNRNEAILSSIGDAVFATDVEGKIILFNEVAEKLTGLTLDEVVGRHYSEKIIFVREDSGKSSGKFIEEAIKNNKITKMSNHISLVRKDGFKIPVADSAAPIKNSSGQIIGCVVVFHDVTQERQVDKAKTEFVSLASHQLRTPLSAVSWYTETLLSGQSGALTEKQKQVAGEIYFSAKRMTSLVDTLLNVSRLEMGTFTIETKPVEVSKIIGGVVKDLKGRIEEKKLKITEVYDEDVPLIMADNKLLNMIFQNILSNSVNYTPDEGSVGIELSVLPEGKMYGGNITKVDSLVAKVTDTGIGIPENQRDKIYSKMFRAENALTTDVEGTGLGLYITKSIIDLSGGKIWYESEVGKGTTFYVTFPLSGMKEVEVVIND